MRILITGSRDWPYPYDVFRTIEQAIALGPNDEVPTIVHGDCPTGADSHARTWCETNPDLVVHEPHPADWSIGKKAGPLRNQHMVDLGADICLAFPQGESRGTRHCMGAADKAGIRVVNVADGEEP